MKERRPLIDGLKSPPPIVDPKVEKDFVFQAKSNGTTPEMPTQNHTAPVARSPISTRIRADFATALKRASLERQLKGIEPSTLQDILEEAIEPWLKSNGCLP